jgi:hypothetical protein
MAVTSDGGVYTWGCGKHGALGHTPADKKLVPTMLDRELLGRVVFVAAKGQNSAAVTAEGILFVWGDGQFGQLGLGDKLGSHTPQCLQKEAFAGSEVLMASIGAQHMLVVTTPGELWWCGTNVCVVLGSDTLYDYQLVPTRVDATHFNEAKIATVAAGRFVSMALTQDGELFSWGSFSIEDYNTGLGHALPNDEYASPKLWPTRIYPLERMQDAHFGRCNRLPQEHALAFAMGSHSRLSASDRKDGDNDVVDLVIEEGKCWVSHLDHNLVQIVVHLCGDWQEGGARELEGVARLMGARVSGYAQIM